MNHMKRYNDYANKLDWLKLNKKFSFYFDYDFFNKNTEYVKKYLNSINGAPNSSQLRKISLLCDLSLLYVKDIEQKYEEYKNEKSVKKKIEIRYGKEQLYIYENKLKNRPKPIVKSTLTVEYWLDKGFSEVDAKRKISKIQSKNSKKRHEKTFNYKIQNPICKEYWKNLGFVDNEEIEKLRKPYLDKCSNTLKRYIEKYGKDEGEKIFYNGVNKRIKTMVEKYGAKTTTCYVSKESLKFLVKLYKVIRKNGIPKNDIIWGISGNKEFVLTDFDNNRSYFYDFVIKSKKIIIEYNNLFWHPRDIKEWKGFGDYDKILEYQEIKKNLAISRGYALYYVWNDENLDQKINYLSEVVLGD
jgi:hypothetical protein